MTDRLEGELRSLAAEVEFPPTPDLAGAVVDRLPERGRRRWWPSAWPRALILAALATLLVAAAATALVLSLPGLRLTFLPALPTPDVPSEPLATRLALGDRLTPGQVEVGVPAALGAPDEAYLLAGGEVVSLVYAADDRLPEIENTGIGLLVQVIDGELDRVMVEKLVVEVGATVTAVTVGTADGYWIEGPPHLIRYLGPAGRASQATRLVGDALVWEEGGVLYRIESGLGPSETLRIAETIGR